MREFTEGYYWMKRTAEPMTIGGRARWIGYYNGHFWEFMGSESQHLTEELASLGTEVLDRVPEEPLKLYTAGFGPFGSVTVVASDVSEALSHMREAHREAADIKAERANETIEVLEIENGTAVAHHGV